MNPDFEPELHHRVDRQLQERINACVALEEAMADLYALFAARYPEEAELFLTLERDEYAHVNVIRAAENFGIIGHEAGLVSPPPMPVIARTLGMVRATIEKYRYTGGISLEEVLRTALSFELSAAEAFIDEVIEGDDAFMTTPVGKIYLAEREHVERVRAALRRIGANKDS